MKATCKFNHTTRPPIPLSLHTPPHHRPLFSTPFSSLSFRTPPPPFSLSSSIKSSSAPNSPLLPKPPQNPIPQILQTLIIPFPTSLLKTTLIATVTATALFFARFNLKPLIAAPISPQPTVETTQDDDIVSEEQVEEYLNSNPNDVEALKILVELKIQKRRAREAIPILEHLISLEPDDIELPLLKSHLHVKTKEYELAKLGFNDILSIDPLCVEAYHGLIMAALESDSSSEVKEIERRIGEGIDKLKKERKKKDEVREFKLLLAQIRVMESVYDDALKIYEELVKEEPRDYRPYMCQGVIYSLLSKKDEAEKCFKKFRRLVPKGHPYASYFDDTMVGNLFEKKVDNDERGASKNEEQMVENDGVSSKNEEQMVENEGETSKNEEQMVENERADSKTEEQVVENERADSKIEEQIVGSK
ncbi:hypothetical protein LguiA_016195 [Lonicera macranthoides]